MITLGQEEMTAGIIGMIILSFFYNFQFFREKFYDTKEVEFFKSTKSLQLKDELLLQMLNENVRKTSASYCITDPDLPDNPIG